MKPVRVAAAQGGLSVFLAHFQRHHNQQNSVAGSRHPRPLRRLVLQQGRAPSAHKQANRNREWEVDVALRKRGVKPHNPGLEGLHKGI